MPGLVLLATDVVRRGGRFATLDLAHRAGVVGALAVSTLIWALVLFTASIKEGVWRHLGAALFVVPYGVAFGVQAAFFARYGVYCGLDAVIDSDSIPWSIVGTLPFDGRLVSHLAFGLALAIAMLVFARRVVRPRRLPRKLRFVPIALALIALLVTPVSYHKWQSTTPDLIYFHGVGNLVRHHVAPPYEHLTRAQRRRPRALPKLEPRPARPRNVLFVLQEAQRFDVSCVAFDDDCQLSTRETNPLLPDRMPLLEMRSNATSTHLSIQVMWSGLSPNASKEAMETAPFLWDYARAAGYDIAYWTSQNAIFGNMRLAIQGVPFHHQVTGTELDPYADPIAGAPDSALADRAIAEIGDLREPWFAIVQYANNHRPRVFDPEHAPFQPTDTESKGRKDIAQKNFYKNVVYLSDRAVARLVEHVRKSDAGARTVIFYTSDHAEGYFEHRQDNDHSGSVYDEEIHVPAWIDAPEGTLSPAEKSAIASKREAYLFHTDVAPTMLDLLGLWDAPEIARFRKTMIGQPITRLGVADVPVPLSNVSWVWEYIVPNYGVMQGSLKAQAIGKDEGWRCFDVASDPKEKYELDGDDARCASLSAAADRAFHVLPKDLVRLKRHPEWGDADAAVP
jgi:arylsulfatase A-like enzyme